MDEVLEARDIHKSFKQPHGEPIHVIRGLNFVVKKGESIAIVGPSGSGKSTLLHILGLMEKPNHGEVRLFGHSVSAQEAKRNALRKRSIGFLFQFDSLIEELTLEENFRLIKDIKALNKAEEQAQRETTLRWIKKLGLSNLMDKYPKTLSSGEKTRANLIRALLGRPQILLADEPTGNLDSKNAQEITGVLKDLLDESKKERQNIEVMVLVTHNLELAQKTDKIYELHDGKLRVYGGG